MSCDELKELYELYALGAVDAEERREIEEHVEPNCPVCGPAVRRARQSVASLALAAPPVEPPRQLRDRVVASVAPMLEHPTSVNWLTHAWATLALVMLAGLLWFVFANRNMDVEMAALNQRLAELRTTNAELEARNRLLSGALALINLPDARQLVFGNPDRQPPRGRIWVHPQRGVLLVASNLAPAPAGKAYEMWVIPKGGRPIPAGLFQSDPQGLATHVWPQRVEAASATIAVTLEPEAGVPAPTSAPLFAASF